MARDDDFDLEPLCTEPAFGQTGGIGAGSHGKDCRKHAPILAQEALRDRGEERADAVRVDHAGQLSLPRLDFVANRHLVPLHALDGFFVELTVALVVASEGRVHQHEVELREWEVRVLGPIHMLG